MEIGIDFGTTYSTVCYNSNGIEGCLQISGSVFIPTCIFIEENKKEYYIGNFAIFKSRELKGRLYVNLKRWIGSTRKNLTSYVRKLGDSHSVEAINEFDILIGGIGSGKDEKLGITTLIYLFLKALIIEVETQLKTPVAGFVCSVPADYNSFKRGYLAKAVEALGREVRALINEPTAAALYSLAITRRPEAVVSVFDFGGGTFDVSILTRTADIYAVVYSIGDNYLGGRDVDKEIIELIYNRLGGRVSRPDLITSIQSVKEDVSNNAEVTEHVIMSAGKNFNFRFTREELRRIAEPFIRKAVNLFTSGLRKLGNPDNVVVLTGGSCALPGVREILMENSSVKDVYFNDKDFRISVAAGAKVYSDILSGASNVRLIDTLTHSLSDELQSLTAKLVFPKGAIVPNEIEVEYSIEGNSMEYGIFEGEHIVSWRNDMTFKGTHHRPSPSLKSDKILYKISVDGRLSIYADGVELVNEMVAAKVDDRFSDYKYLDDVSVSILNYMPAYVRDVNTLFKSDFTSDSLLDIIRRKKVQHPLGLFV